MIKVFPSVSLPEVLRFILTERPEPAIFVCCSQKQFGTLLLDASPDNPIAWTLDNVQRLQMLNTIFVPSVAHLRAALNTFVPSQNQDLVIFGAIDLHRNDEHSVSQLLHTFAGAVETALSSGGKILLFELEENWLYHKFPLLSGSEDEIDVGRVLSRWGIDPIDMTPKTIDNT